LQVRGVATEEVFDAHRSHLADADAAGGELVNAGDGDVFDTVLLKQADEFGEAFGGRGRHRDDNFFEPQFSLGTGTGNYVEGQAILTITDWLTVSTNIGHQWVETAPADYTHSDVGATATWKSFSLDARYVSTTLNRANCNFYMGTKNACTGGFVATLSYNFALFP